MRGCHQTGSGSDDPPSQRKSGVRPQPYLDPARPHEEVNRLPPLISYDEALALGEIEDHAEIEALVDRAFRVRLEHFGDSTDMCSLVNAKSGGCAEDCGFCADRKSTRLNSSHANISYAVFCLKKKA